MEVDHKKRINIKKEDDSNLINLKHGLPSTELLLSCCDKMDIATKHRMEIEKSQNATLFQYGPTTGRHDFRSELSKFLGKHYKNPVNCDDLILTNGATYGLTLVLSTYLDLCKGVIFVDELTYMRAMKQIALFPAIKVIPIALNEDGVDVIDLEQKVIQHKFHSNTKLFWGMYYTMPVFHNPTGIVFSDDICRKLIILSRKYDFLILCEDVYNMLSYKTDYLPTRLFAYDNIIDADYKGNVISNGTFSKIFAPGLSVGWLECPPRCIKLFLRCVISGASNNYTSGIVTSLMQLGLADQQYEINLSNYKERMLLACKLLKNHLPKTCSFNEPKGGYFIWVRFPDGTDLSGFCEYTTEQHGFSVFSGDNFSPNQCYKNCLRICISFNSVDKLKKAIIKLCLLTQDLLKNKVV